MMKLLTCMLLLAAMAVSADAQTVIFTPQTDLGHNAVASATERVADSVAKEGLVVACSDASFANGTDYRFYSGSSTTITSTVGPITEIVFTCTAKGSAKYGPGNFSGRQNFSSGSYKFSGTRGTWTGRADRVAIANANQQVRAKQIEVTVDTSDGIRSVTLPVGEGRQLFRLDGRKAGKATRGIVVVRCRKYVKTR